MATIETIYSGQLRTKARHVASGMEIITDAPADNRGKGEAFSPTDLLAGALGSCMLTIMGITADKNLLNIDGTTVSIVKIMANNPRRVAEIHIEMKLPPNGFTTEQKKLLENAALTCPVALSIHPDIQQKVNFNYA